MIFGIVLGFLHMNSLNPRESQWVCLCLSYYWLKLPNMSRLWMSLMIRAVDGDWWLLNLFNFRWRRERIFNKTLALEIESEIYNYAKSNLAIINIFIKEPYSKRFRKTEKMSRIAYIASSGGLLGLCMGFSFVSLAEILYHCFICVSIFFKKSSKSTHVMKDLYTSHSHKTSN